MIITAIIAEYNPFHNGHAYMVEKVKKETNADYIIAIMSGDFTQRGLPGITDKFTRAKMATACGVSAVFELPVRFATSSAEIFATGAVSFFQQLSCINYLAFGSECGTLSDFSKASDYLLNEPENFKQFIRTYQKQGHSYPKAFSMAIKETGHLEDISPELFSSPNNLLGLEYMKALKRFASSIQPHTIARTGTGYHDAHSSFSNDSGTLIASASAIRSILETKTGSIAPAMHLLPEPAYRIFADSYGIHSPITLDDFSLLLAARLSTETKENLANYLDVSKDLADRIYTFRNDFLPFSELIQKIKHKQYTHSRINRALLHILLNITKTETTPSIPYARLLALRKDASPLMKEIKSHSLIPIITKAADASKVLNQEAYKLFLEDVFAANLYSKVASNKYHSPYVQDIRHSIELM